MKKTLIYSLLVAGLILSLFSCAGKKSEIQVAKAKKGKFLIDVVETGEIKATKSINISSPALSWRFGMLKITQIVDDGAEVSIGDTVVLFDPSEIYKAKIDANAELEIAKAELKKLLAEQASKIQDLKTALEINELTFKIAEIKLEQASFEAEVTKKEIQLNLEKTKIDLIKAKKEIENQKQIHKEEIKQSKLKINQLESNVWEADETIKKMFVTSPGTGIAIVGKNWSTDSKWQVGDQPWSGTPLITLPDLSQIKVDVEINEVDISKIKKGQLAEIKLDAFTNSDFTGRVTSVATLAKFKDEKKSKIKVFPVTVVLDRTSKELLPGMTVSCRIIVDEIENVVYVPSEAIQKLGSESFVYIKTAGDFKIRKVKIGLTNNDYVIIEEGLNEGDEVSLSIPEKFQEGA